MLRLLSVFLAPIVLLLATACGDTQDETASPTPTVPGATEPSTPTETASPTEPSAPATPTPTPTASDGGDAVCLPPDTFEADGPVSLDPAGDDTLEDGRVLALRWAEHEDCERLVIDIATEDSDVATGIGEVSAEILRDLGVVRVHLHDVDWIVTDVDVGVQEGADIQPDGPLVSAAYSVRSEDGYLFVDIHLASPAEAAVTTLSDPGRVVVDLRPGGAPIPPRATVREGLAVILEPRADEATYPLEVVGYARTFEANVVVRLLDGDEVVYQDNTTATSWADAWGYYTFTIEDGPTGQVELQVGDFSARDGTWEGVSVDLNIE